MEAQKIKRHPTICILEGKLEIDIRKDMLASCSSLVTAYKAVQVIVSVQEVVAKLTKRFIRERRGNRRNVDAAACINDLNLCHLEFGSQLRGII